MHKTLITLFIFLLCLESQAQKLPTKNFGDYSLPVNMVEFTRDGKRLIAGGFFKIWNISNTSTPEFEALENNVGTEYEVIRNSDISNDGKYLAALSIGRIEVYDLQSTEIVKTIKKAKVSGVAFGPNNQIAYISYNNSSLIITDINSKKPISEKKFKNVKPSKVAWSESGKYIAVGGRGDHVVILDHENDILSSSIRIEGKSVSDLEFSPNNKLLAISQFSGTVTIVETATGVKLATRLAHQGGTFALSFHPNSKYLATGGNNNMIRIYAAPDWQYVDTWKAHDKAVHSLCFSPDGLMLASGSNNAQVGGVNDTKIWTLDDDIKQNILAERIQTNQPDDNVSNPVFTKPEESNLQASNQGDQKRLALLIGNGMYQNAGILANPENDANDIGKSLQNLGFDVMLYNNLDQKGFKVAIDEFGAKLSDYDIGLFYYAGHGIQVKGNNYLIPVDANLKSENDVEYDCVNAGRLLAKMEDAGSTTNIVILDACRDNPFERSWRRSTQGLGLAFMTAPAGSLISYATSPGATASDGSGRNGLFTSALLEYIDQPNLSLMEMFQKVRTYVRQNSDGQQVPWESTSLEGNFYFKINQLPK